MKMPGHAESYNPPAEYLWTKEEEETFLKMAPEAPAHAVSMHPTNASRALQEHRCRRREKEVRVAVGCRY
jgi:ribosome biogenesis protein ERB1